MTCQEITEITEISEITEITEITGKGQRNFLDISPA